MSLGAKLTGDAILDSVSVTLASPPEVIGSLPAAVETQVLAFVSKNRGVLREHWHGEINTGDVLERLRRV